MCSDVLPCIAMYCMYFQYFRISAQLRVQYSYKFLICCEVKSAILSVQHPKFRQIIPRTDDPYKERIFVAI